MTINHLNLPVTDVIKVVHFFETYFDYTCQSLKGDGVIAVLKNQQQFVLVLMQNKNGGPTYPKNFHVGFFLNSPEAVDEQHRKLKAGGLILPQLPQMIRDSYSFYFYFDDLFIEVGYYVN